MKPAMNHFVNPPNNKFMTYSFKGQTPASLVLSKNHGMHMHSKISTVHFSYILYNDVMMGILIF